MEKVIDLEQRLKEEGLDTSAYEILAALTKAAILDPSQIVRQISINELTNLYKGFIRKGYELNGKLYLKINNKEDQPNTYFICQMPEEYIGKPSKPVPFDLDSN